MFQISINGRLIELAYDIRFNLNSRDEVFSLASPTGFAAKEVDLSFSISTLDDLLFTYADEITLSLWFNGYPIIVDGRFAVHKITKNFGVGERPRQDIELVGINEALDKTSATLDAEFFSMFENLYITALRGADKHHFISADIKPPEDMAEQFAGKHFGKVIINRDGVVAVLMPTGFAIDTDALIRINKTCAALRHISSDEEESAGNE